MAKKPYKSYLEKLQDVRWQRKRLKLLDAANWTCTKCGETERDGITLQVHHGYYRKGFEPWDYPDKSYHVLCRPCHEEMQELKEDIEEIVFSASPRSQHSFCAALFGLMAHQHQDESYALSRIDRLVVRSFYKRPKRGKLFRNRRRKGGRK